MLARLGAIPRGGECFDYGAYRFTVTAMDRRRIARVNIQRLVKPTEDAAGSPSASPAAMQDAKNAAKPTAKD